MPFAASWSFPSGSATRICLQWRRFRRCGFDPGLWRSLGEEHGNSLQYSCLENPMDRGSWWTTVRRITKSWTWLKQRSMHAISWMDLEIIILKWNKLDRERHISNGNTYMWNLKKKKWCRWNLSTEQKQIYGLKGQACGYQVGKVWGGMNWGWNWHMHTTICKPYNQQGPTE